MKTNKFQYISFDIFDTLIKRNVSKPSDLFRLLEDKEINGLVVPDNFCELRTSAEINATKNKGSPVTLKEIYDELSVNDDQFRNALMEIEINAELDFCCPNFEYVELFNKCIKEGKTVVLISDMYLPSEVLKKMLEKCDICGYHKLYVSCEHKAKKSDGSLFKKVISDLHLKPHQLLHIGDNMRSDVLSPAKLGIPSIRVLCNSKKICNKSEKIKIESPLDYRTVMALIENVSNNINENEKLGCSTLGPILLGFTLWLAEEIKKAGISNVYFMSREGDLLKKAFDSLNIKGINTHYLYCSRRSYIVPLFWKYNDYEDIFNLITIPKREPLQSFMVRLGLEPNDFLDKISKFDLSLDYVVRKEDLRVKEFYDEIKNAVIENSKKEYDSLALYLKEIDLNGKIAVVDIGRHGTMQNALQQIAKLSGLNIDITGYYVGIAKKAPLIESGIVKASGYLHEKGKNEYIEAQIAKFVSIFESSFLAQHGSVEKFCINNDKLEVCLYPYEYETAELKFIDEISVIKSYQKGALSLVKSFGAFCQKYSIELSVDAIFYNMMRMGTNPTLAEAKLWGDFRVFDNVIFLIARPRLKNNLKYDFLASPWKIGYLRRLFKIPLPYYHIYDLLRRIANKNN